MVMTGVSISIGGREQHCNNQQCGCEAETEEVPQIAHLSKLVTDTI
jgi:hypothetical protein